MDTKRRALWQRIIKDAEMFAQLASKLIAQKMLKNFVSQTFNHTIQADYNNVNNEHYHLQIKSILICIIKDAKNSKIYMNSLWTCAKCS